MKHHAAKPNLYIDKICFIRHFPLVVLVPTFCSAFRTLPVPVFCEFCYSIACSTYLTISLEPTIVPPQKILSHIDYDTIVIHKKLKEFKVVFF